MDGIENTEPMMKGKNSALNIKIKALLISFNIAMETNPPMVDYCTFSFLLATAYMLILCNFEATFLK